MSGSTYCFLGRPDEALERLRNAWRLSPFDPLNFFFCTVAGIAEFVAGRYDQADRLAPQGAALNPRFAACHRTLTASLALSGDLEGATGGGRESPGRRARFPCLAVHRPGTASAAGRSRTAGDWTAAGGPAGVSVAGRNDAASNSA